MKVFLGGLAVFLVYCLVYSCNARAEGLHVLDLDTFSMETAKLVNFNDPYYGYADPKGATTEHWDTYTAVHFNLDLVRFDDWGLYFNNTVEGASTSSQYRETAWEWEAGANLDSKAQFFWHHRSAHVLDAERPGEHFPLTNYYGVRVTFYKRGADE